MALDSREECQKSSLHSLIWAYSRMTKEKQKVPSWSGFKELISKPELDQMVVGYLLPIPFSPTDNKTIYAEIRRTQDIMVELETEFIFIEADQAIYTRVLDIMFALKNKGEDLFKIFDSTYGWFSYWHVYDSNHLRTIQKMWHCSTAFFIRIRRFRNSQKSIIWRRCKRSYQHLQKTLRGTFTIKN